MTPYDLTDDAKKLMVLAHRVFCDYEIDYRLDAAYAMAETEQNQWGVVERCVHLRKERCVTHIALSDNPHPEYIGYKKLHDYLKEQHHILSAAIVRICYRETEVMNTLNEAETAVRYAKAAGWRTIYVVASPLHHLRTFLTFVSVALREYPELILVSCPGIADDWNTSVPHSQGVVMGKRQELIIGELERLAAYYAESWRTTRHLASPDAILAYLDARDKRFKKKV